MLSALSKFLSTLLVGLLTALVFTTVLNQTVLDSHYIENKLTATNSYERLSVALTDQASQKVAGVENQQAAAMLKPILTPEVLKTKINGALDQMQAYYQGNGPRPTLDLTDLAAQAQAAGIPIPADSPLAKPIQLSPSARAKGDINMLNTVRTITLVGAVLVAVALLAVSWARHKWVALPDVLIVVGVLVGLVAAVAALASGMAGRYVTAGSGADAFALIGRDVGVRIANDLAGRFGIIAGLLLVVGIAARIWVGKMQAKAPITPAASRAALKQAAKA